MSFCRILWSASEVMERQILVSSAYRARLVPGLRPDGRSFIKSTNRIGPNMDPCGTPERTGLFVDLTLSTMTHCSLPER